MKKFLISALALTLFGCVSSQTQAATLTPTNLDSLSLGAKIVGPVGPEVETTFVNAEGIGLGDLISSVSCPTGFDSCLPPQNPAGTIYTYIHQVTPGVDFPNDAPFPAPDVVQPVQEAEAFRLNFPASGFNGVAGYSFAESSAALTDGSSLSIKESDDGSLIWNVPTDAGWTQGETISFFWQTTQNPSGPGGVYEFAGDGQSGTANGPVPTPVPEASEVPEPGAIAPLAILSAALLLKRRFSNS